MKVKSLKWLRILHIMSAAIWFGGTICILAVALMCFSSSSEAAFLITAPLIPELYRRVILPAALFIILQGHIYGFFTNWGFIKHKWVTAKWIFTILLIPCIGAGAIGQMFSLIEKVKQSGYSSQVYEGNLFLVFIILQVLIMLLMISISALKPWKKKLPGEKI
jgi:uncharacterized membrane protein